MFPHEDGTQVHAVREFPAPPAPKKGEHAAIAANIRKWIE